MNADLQDAIAERDAVIERRVREEIADELWRACQYKAANIVRGGAA